MKLVSRVSQEVGFMQLFSNNFYTVSYYHLPERKLSVKGLAAGGGQEPEQAARRPRRLSASISSQDQLRPQDAAELRGAGEE